MTTGELIAVGVLVDRWVLQTVLAREIVDFAVPHFHGAGDVRPTGDVLAVAAATDVGTVVENTRVDLPLGLACEIVVPQQRVRGMVSPVLVRALEGAVYELLGSARAGCLSGYCGRGGLLSADEVVRGRVLAGNKLALIRGPGRLRGSGIRISEAFRAHDAGRVRKGRRAAGCICWSRSYVCRGRGYTGCGILCGSRRRGRATWCRWIAGFWPFARLDHGKRRLDCLNVGWSSRGRLVNWRRLR